MLNWVSEGLTTERIAERLFISLLTVETHRRHMMQKFDINNTAALIKRAVEEGMV